MNFLRLILDGGAVSSGLEQLIENKTAAEYHPLVVELEPPSISLIFRKLVSKESLNFQLKKLAAFLNSLALLLVAFSISFVVEAQAGFASRFSLSVGEEYNDNIFFVKNKSSDFITFITPTFSFLYTPAPEIPPTFTLDISPSGQIFARQSDLSNFGDNILFDTRYTYLYSPKLTFYVLDALRKAGETRTSGFRGTDTFPLPQVPTAQAVSLATDPLLDFVSTENTLANSFSFEGRFLYAPNITFAARYASAYEAFFDVGGRNLSHSVNLRGLYEWRKEHNLHAGYGVVILKSRNGDNSVIHNFDLGDDYFSTQTIQLTPTLTLSGSTGVSLNTGDGPRIANNSTLTLIKVWERALFNAGIRKGFTGSSAVAGASDTLTFFAGFSIRLTENLGALAGADYSRFDTKDTDFNTFKAQAGFQYGITSWLCSDLKYNHRWVDSGSGASTTDLLSRGKVSGNSIFLVFSGHFDIWPSLQLAKRPVCPASIPYAVQSPPPT